MREREGDKKKRRKGYEDKKVLMNKERNIETKEEKMREKNRRERVSEITNYTALFRYAKQCPERK